jgi:hypothetical protein
LKLLDRWHRRTLARGLRRSYPQADPPAIRRALGHLGHQVIKPDSPRERRDRGSRGPRRCPGVDVDDHVDLVRSTLLPSGTRPSAPGPALPRGGARAAAPAGDGCPGRRADVHRGGPAGAGDRRPHPLGELTASPRRTADIGPHPPGIRVRP